VFSDILDFRNRSLHFIGDSIKSAFGENCVFEYDNSIVIFFNLNAYDGDSEHIETSLFAFLQDNNLKAGVSNVFSGFENFKQYYLQACAALDLGPRLKPYTWMYRFEDVVEVFVLENCTALLPAHMLCAPGLLKLKAYDAEHHTELYHTLYIFLKNNLRSVNAAKELFIHRSTFLYRLERIREIIGMNIENNEDQWYLLLSFKLLEYADRQPS
jgi:DNA-binding PucR family transcriptional regulator